MVVLGSTGEAVELNDEETCEVLKIAAGGHGAGKGSYRRRGPGRACTPPWNWPKPQPRLATTRCWFARQPITRRQCRLRRFSITSGAWRTARPLPVILYNIPRLAPYNIPVELVAELAQHANIIGIKDSTGSLEQIRALIAATQFRAAPRRSGDDCF